MTQYYLAVDGTTGKRKRTTDAVGTFTSFDLTADRTLTGKNTFSKGTFYDDDSDASFTVAAGKSAMYPTLNVQSSHTITVEGSLYSHVITGAGDVTAGNNGILQGF